MTQYVFAPRWPRWRQVDECPFNATQQPDKDITKLHHVSWATAVANSIPLVPRRILAASEETAMTLRSIQKWRLLTRLHTESSLFCQKQTSNRTYNQMTEKIQSLNLPAVQIVVRKPKRLEESNSIQHTFTAYRKCSCAWEQRQCSPGNTNRASHYSRE